MDIDLLISKGHDVGLVSNGKFENIVTAAIFDHETRRISLEFGEAMDSMNLNIPVTEEFVPYLSQRSHLFMIGTDRTYIYEAYDIPLIHINDFKDPELGGWK